MKPRKNLGFFICLQTPWNKQGRKVVDMGKLISIILIVAELLGIAINHKNLNEIEVRPDTIQKYAEVLEENSIQTVDEEILERIEELHHELVRNSEEDVYEIIDIDINKRYLYEQMVEDIKRLEEAYPQIIQAEIIGQSEDNRDIYLIKLGKGKVQALMLGGVHAREIANTPLIMKMINEYARLYYKIGELDGFNVRNLLDSVTLYIVPLVNPDGMEIVVNGEEAIRTPELREALKKMPGNRRMWKANARGVDLNRNFPNEYWNVVLPGRTKSKLISSVPSAEFYNGEYAASEKEVRTIVELVNNNDFKVMFDIHSRGRVIYWYKLAKSEEFNARVYEIAKAVSKVSGYEPLSKAHATLGIGTNGNTTDFTIEKDIYSITVETMPYDIPSPYPVDLIVEEWDRFKSIGLVLADESLKVAREQMLGLSKIETVAIN